MKKFLLLPLILILVIGCSQQQEDSEVRISERKILLNDEPYFIKGICYHPVQKGETNRDFSPIKEDLAIMKEAGINTIRVYEPITEEWVLDAIAEAGMKVIIGFGYNQDGNYDILSGTFVDYIEMFKNHESILMWELGNEYNYHPEWFEGDITNWYTRLEAATRLIHQIDKKHPVTTAHGEIPDSLALAMVPSMDVWGMNVYRWDDPETIYQEWAEVSDKPMYLSEAGGDSYMTITKDGYEEGVNEKAQADANRNILDDVFRNKEIGSGVTLFQFTDGWWKAGNPETQDPGGWAPNSSGVPYDGTPNEEYWGIVDIDRNKKATFSVVKDKFTQN